MSVNFQLQSLVYAYNACLIVKTAQVTATFNKIVFESSVSFYPSNMSW